MADHSTRPWDRSGPGVSPVGGETTPGLPGHQNSTPTFPSLWRSVRVPVVIFLILASLIGGLGYTVYAHQRQAIGQARTDELSTIANRKAEEIAHWLAERRSDGEFIAREPFLSATVRHWFDTDASDDSARLSAWLTALQETFGFTAALLLDPSGQIRLSAGASQLHPEQQALVRQAMTSGQVIIGDLHRRHDHLDSPIDLDLIVPLMDGIDDRGSAVGVLLLKIDPTQYLYPLIRSWPTATSPGAETLLVRRQGDSVEYLNELRDRPNAPLQFRLPLSTPQLVTAQAVQGRTGVIAGVNYQRIPVLAAVQAIPETTWSVVVEVDIEAIDAPLRTQMARVALVAALLIAAAALVVTLGWRQHHIRLVAESYRREWENQLHLTERRETEVALDHSRTLLQTLVESTSDAIFIKDLQGRYLLINSALARIAGRNPDEVIGQDDTHLFPVDEADQIMVGDRRVLEGRTTAILEETLTTAGGEKRVYQSTKGIIVDSQGEVIGLFGIAHDITARKQAEAKLAEQKDLLETILQQAAEAIVMCDAQGNPLLVNAAARRLALGEDRAEPETGPSFLWGKAYYPDGHPIPLQAWPMHKALHGATTIGAEARVVRPDGSSYDMLISAAPVRRDETIIGAVAMFSDITERKRVEEKWLYQLRLNQAITDSATDSIIVTDAEGRIRCINPEAERVFGYRADELIDASLHERLHRHDLDHHPLPLNQCPLATIHTTGATVRDHEDVLFHKDGSILTVECSTALLESRGKRLGMVFFIRDITERKRAEAALRESAARLRAIIHAVPDVLLVLDQDGRYLEILTPQPELLHTDPASLKDRLLSEVLPEAIARKTIAAIQQTLRTRQIQNFEYELPFRKSGKHHFEARVAPLDGLVLGRPAVVLLARDVTQHRLTEESLRHAQKMEAIGQLTGGVAHDFNNLLAIIQGNLELLTERLDQAELRDLTQRALGAVERGATLIRQLLAFGRRQPLQAKPTNLNTLVKAISDLLRRTLGETIELETLLADDLATTVIDRNQFETALLNLALNARDAMPNGGRLTLETATVWLDEEYAALHRPIKPGCYALLTVRDTGTGMPPEVLERALEPFFTTKKVGKGSGLGLSMVYGLVNQMAGTIQLYSELGHGTTIHIYLPASETVPDPVSAAHVGETLSQPGQGQLILVVEDEAMVRQLAVNMLQSLGYRTVEADIAATALQILAETPQVVALFTDVVLPGGESGADLARIAQQRWPHLKVLFTSGYIGHHLAAFNRQEGAGWLSKPYRKSQLANKLHALLGGDSAARAPTTPPETPSKPA